jgi:hypothetical protein
MQNRRLLKDDYRGVREPLNEKDFSGDGIKVNSIYYLSIFDGRLKGRISPQRRQ